MLPIAKILLPVDFSERLLGAAHYSIGSRSIRLARYLAKKLFSYPGPEDPCTLVRTSEGAYVAFSQKCTHLSCAAFYQPEHRRRVCACHESYFSVRDGSVLQGPPSRPLPLITLERRDGDLVATGVRVNREDAWYAAARVDRNYRGCGAMVILLMVQIWLLTATQESFLAGHRETAIPAALISGLLFLACMGIFLLVNRLDREARQD